MQWDQMKIHNENDHSAVDCSTHVTTGRRRVRFLSGDAVVLNCLEPFRAAPDTCTSEELIAAYIASCKLHKTSAIEFLLEQLKGIDLSICNERYSRLSLRGIRLNHLQIETLEEVFRRANFREVDLENTFLDEASATALLDMLLHYETCTALSISLSLEKSGPSIAWSRCITYLRKSSILQHFKLSHTPLSPHHFMGLNLSGLSLKHISFHNCSFAGPVLREFVRWLRYLLTFTRTWTDSKSTTSSNRCPRLSYRGPIVSCPWGLSLHLVENKISVQDVKTLLSLVRHHLVFLPGPPTPGDGGVMVNRPTGGIGFLEELNLAQNAFKDAGVEVLCSGLMQVYRMQQRRLEVAVAAITEATQRSPSVTASYRVDLPEAGSLPTIRGLERLCLADNNLGPMAACHLASVLSQSTIKLAPLIGGLTSLDLSNNPGLEDAGIELLCDGLLRNATMRQLYLRNVRMRFGGVLALTGYLGETRSLEFLDIRQNVVDVSGIMALAKAMKINKSLTTLLLDARTSTVLLQNDKNYDLARQFLQELDECLRLNRNISYTRPVPVKDLVELDKNCNPTKEISSLPIDAPAPNGVELADMLLDRPIRGEDITSASPKDLDEIGQFFNDSDGLIDCQSLQKPIGGNSPSIGMGSTASSSVEFRVVVEPIQPESPETASTVLGDEPPMEFDEFLQMTAEIPSKPAVDTGASFCNYSTLPVQLENPLKQYPVAENAKYPVGQSITVLQPELSAKKFSGSALLFEETSSHQGDFDVVPGPDLGGSYDSLPTIITEFQNVEQKPSECLEGDKEVLSLDQAGYKPIVEFYVEDSSTNSPPGKINCQSTEAPLLVSGLVPLGRVDDFQGEVKPPTPIEQASANFGDLSAEVASTMRAAANCQEPSHFTMDTQAPHAKDSPELADPWCPSDVESVAASSGSAVFSCKTEHHELARDEVLSELNREVDNSLDFTCDRADRGSNHSLTLGPVTHPLNDTALHHGDDHRSSSSSNLLQPEGVPLATERESFELNSSNGLVDTLRKQKCRVAPIKVSVGSVACVPDKQIEALKHHSTDHSDSAMYVGPTGKWSTPSLKTMCGTGLARETPMAEMRLQFPLGHHPGDAGLPLELSNRSYGSLGSAENQSSLTNERKYSSEKIVPAIEIITRHAPELSFDKAPAHSVTQFNTHTGYPSAADKHPIRDENALQVAGEFTLPSRQMEFPRSEREVRPFEALPSGCPTESTAPHPSDPVVSAVADGGDVVECGGSGGDGESDCMFQGSQVPLRAEVDWKSDTSDAFHEQRLGTGIR